jgi:hypothetical protein
MALLKETWASGNYTSGKIDEDALANAKAIGMYQALEGMFNLEYETLEDIYEK